MRTLFGMMMSLCLGSVIVLGCSDQAFHITSDPSSYSGNQGVNQGGQGGSVDDPSQPAIQIDTQKPGSQPDPGLNGGYISDTPLGSVTFKGAFSEEEIPGTNKPVAIMFLIDETGSMGKYINAVRNSISTFVNNLTSRNYQVKLGLISYEDNIMSETDIGINVNSFINTLANLRTVDGEGGDSPEGGFKAIQRGAQKLNNSSLDSYMKIMVLISDNFSHDENYTTENSQDMYNNLLTNRSCSINSTVNALNTYSKKFQEQTKIFYSVPSMSTYPNLSRECLNYLGMFPNYQMNELLTNSFNKLNASVSRGGFLGWPFDQNTLLQDLANKIIEVAPTKLVCLTNNIEVKLNDTLSVNYTSTFKQAYDLYKKSGSPVSTIFDKRIPDILKGLGSSQRYANVTQSCFDMVDAKNNNFNSPKVSNRKITIPFEFKQ